MTIKEIMEMNPVLVTGIATSFVGVVGALGLKELLAKAVERYWHKADQKELDHQQLQELAEKVDKIIEKLEAMEAKEQQYLDNDMLVIANDILFLQRKSLLLDKVSKSCYPWYMKLYNRYSELNEKSEMPFDEEIDMNHKLIQQMMSEGKVVDDFRELYK